MQDVELFLRKCEVAGHDVFTERKGRPYNLNIVGWRNALGRVNQFDDCIAVYWQDCSRWYSKVWPATTCPGVPWLLKPMVRKGTAVLVPGQYRRAYMLALYRDYIALRQVKPVRVWRDNDRDSDLDLPSVTVEEGLFGIHIHRAGIWSKVVGQSSAGCQVFQKHADFAEFIELCKKASEYWDDLFTYTLLEF